MPSLITSERGPSALLARGAWTLANVETLERLYGDVRPGAPIDLSGVTALDTVGAWLFEKLARRGAAPSSETAFIGVSDSHAGLLREVRGLNRGEPGGTRKAGYLIDRMVGMARGLAADSVAFLHMLGAVGVALCLPCCAVRDRSV